MKLNQITVPVLNVEKAIAFYETLGLTLIVKSPHYARFWVKDGNATFSVHQVTELPESEGVWIYFETETLDETVASLQEKGVLFEELPNDKPWLWREARLKDPDNNILVLYYAGENRLNPPWRI